MDKKRIAAIAGLALIGLLYLSTLVLSFIDSPFARSCLMAALFGTIVVPVVLYGYMTFTGSRPDMHRERDQQEESDSQPNT